MPESIYHRYTYLIGWSSHNRYYYGVRYATSCNPSEFWSSYFTSSRHVKEFVRLHGDPDIIQIRRTFSNADDARLWEHKVLRRLNVVNDPRFLNKSDGLSVSLESSIQGGRQKKSDTMRKRLSEYRTGKITPQKTREAISISKKGSPLSEEARIKRKQTMSDPLVRKKLSEIGKTKIGELNSFYGKTHSDETKQKISKSKKGTKSVNRKPVVIDGVEYESIKQAHLVTGISKYFIRKTLK